MPVALDPVRPIKIDEIREARKRIAGTIVRTPLVRLELGPELSRCSTEAGESSADQRLQITRRGQRRRDVIG